MKKLLTMTIALVALSGFSQGTNYAKISQLSAVTLTTNDFFVGLHWTGTNYSAMRFRWNDVKIYADTNMAVLAPLAWVSNVIAPLSTTNYVQSASNGAVAQAVSVASNQTSVAIAPLVTTNALETRLQPIATTNYVAGYVSSNMPYCRMWGVVGVESEYTNTFTFPSPFPFYNSYCLFLDSTGPGTASVLYRTASNVTVRVTGSVNNTPTLVSVGIFPISQ